MQHGADDGAGEVVIEISHVTKRFGDFVAVDDADFGIRRGEFFSMLGPSGCGKTTTLRMIAGFEVPTIGTITLAGEDVTEVPPAKRNVNMVFQAYALFPHMTVQENVEFGLRIKKVKKDEVASRAAEAIASVQLEGFEQRKPAQQDKRSAIASIAINACLPARRVSISDTDHSLVVSSAACALMPAMMS